MQRGGSGSDQAGVASVLAALLPAGTCRKGLRSHDTEALLERQVSMLSMPRGPPCEWRKSRGMDPFILLRAALNKRAHIFRRTYFSHMTEIGPVALHCTIVHPERRELWLASAAIRRWRTHQNHGNKLRHRTPVLTASICRSNWVPSSRQRQPRLPLWR